jgi:hypothetical protein
MCIRGRAAVQEGGAPRPAPRHSTRLCAHAHAHTCSNARAPAALALVFLPSFIVFVALDVLWIAFIGKDVYAGLKPILKARERGRRRRGRGAPAARIQGGGVPRPLWRRTPCPGLCESAVAPATLRRHLLPPRLPWPRAAPAQESPDTAAAALSWACIVLANYAFVLPRTGGAKPAWHVIGQARRAALGAGAGAAGRCLEGPRERTALATGRPGARPKPAPRPPPPPTPRARCLASCCTAPSTSPTAPC